MILLILLLFLINILIFMLDDVKLPNDIFIVNEPDNEFNKDLYSQFYGFHIKDKKERKKWEKMIKEMREPYRTKLIHSS